MAKIKDKDAYFKQCVLNSLKNEYRQNDNAAKYIMPVDLHIADKASLTAYDDEQEKELSYENPENWLLFIESPNLHRALSSLRKRDLELLFLLFVVGCTQRDVAKLTGVSLSAINKRYLRIKKIIKNSL
ncbi:sigma factor-like helix-turn-helix DNA-binding protein [Anaerotruncus rubiinfantis]|uniref:sigma factor-like helix-turn-helix DNA-binding protein n=1 Tax=Anaerotruncus rubiinfantis TaxID=1720200 RepID=UPI0034A287F2